MINLFYSSSGTGTIAVYPDVTASSYPINTDSSSFSLEVVQEYDRSSGSLDLTLINVPNKFSPRLVFNYSRNQVPQYSGQYTAYIKEGTSTRPVWGSTSTLWADADWKWGSTSVISNQSVIDTDRVWISGSDFTSPTQYVSPDENGTYTTYHV